MPHHFSEIAIVILLCSLSAVLLTKLKQLPMVGYVLAGILIGPAMLGVISDEQQISFYAELGVILLLFILGIELELKSFRETYKIAVPATFLLIILSLAITFSIGLFVDLSLNEKLVYGFIISLSSTAVAVKLLSSVGLLDKGPGQMAISILIAQDLLFVPMIMTINALGSDGGMNWDILPKMIGAVGVLVGLIIFLSKKERVHLLFEKTVEKHNDLIPVAALAWCFVFAGASEWAGLSPAYGAFLAGLIIGNSHSQDKVLPKIEPMESVMLMVFFMSIGMLIDFDVIVSNAGTIAALLLGTLIFKTIVCISLLRGFLPAERWRRSFIAGLTISQIGEFSFILAATALGNGIFDNESYKIIIAVIALSLMFSPLWKVLLRRFVDVAYDKRSAKNMSEAVKACVTHID